MGARVTLFAGCAYLALSAGAAQAQDAAAGVDAPAAASSPAPAGAASSAPAEIVVTGFRQSLATAQGVKRNATQIVDSIVAADIGKLPDINTSDALQRVTGVQIARDYGEGSTVSVRGLTQVSTTLNGHEIFTATPPPSSTSASASAGGRVLNFENLPAALLSRVDVYKSQSANLIEGGLGGTIDVRTQHPFDFKGPEVDGTAFLNYGDLIKKSKPQLSLLASDRWDTGIGEIGLLGSIAYQERAFREDRVSAGAPITQSYQGRSYIVPNNFYDPLYTGDRKRLGASAIAQWRPNSELEFYGEFEYQREKTTQSNYISIVNTPSLTLAGPPTTYPDSNYVQSVSYANATYGTWGVHAGKTDTNKQASVGGKWTHDKLTVKGDFSYSWARESTIYNELDFDQQVPQVTIDTTHDIVSTVVSGRDLLDPANYSLGGLIVIDNISDGHEKAAQLDADYEVDAGPLQSISAGVRYSDTSEVFSPIRYNRNFYNASGAGNIPITDFPGLYQVVPYSIFSRVDGSVPVARDFILADPAQLTSLAAIFKRLGITDPLPGIQQNSVFSIREKTFGGYVMAKYKFDLGVPIDGNVGVRVVRTTDDLNGFSMQPDGSYLPANRNNNYVSVLPSLNARAHLTDNLLLRVGLYKSLTRPDFTLLSPSITLQPSTLTASRGNPDLQPLKANNADVSLEWYFSRSGSLTVAGLYKRVRGFLLTTIAPEQIDGQTYNISFPANSGAGTVKGVEAAYQQFFDFLPGALKGFGIQANFTFIDSKVPTTIPGFQTPLPNLSKYSYNIVGLYERGKIQARVAYNWRSSYVAQIYAGSAGVPALPDYTEGYGWLDAALNLKINDNATFSIEGSNLLQTKINGIYSTKQSPWYSTIDDRQILVGVHLHW